MPRGKQDGKKASTNQDPNKKSKDQGKIQDPPTDGENSVNGEELTMSQLRDMINKQAADMFEKKEKGVEGRTDGRNRG